MEKELLIFPEHMSSPTVFSDDQRFISSDDEMKLLFFITIKSYFSHQNDSVLL
jgi:hypothetical protein